MFDLFGLLKRYDSLSTPKRDILSIYKIGQNRPALVLNFKVNDFASE
jgi:hypothetical protein